MVFRHTYYKKKLPHIMGNEAKPNKEKNKKMTTTLPTRAQQHITYKQTVKTNISSLCLRHLTTLSCGCCKSPNDTRHHWLSPSS
jgi:hypothetical protein